MVENIIKTCCQTQTTKEFRAISDDLCSTFSCYICT